MILFIDNYDSFVYNLVHYVQIAGQQVKVVRNDAITLTDLDQMDITGIVVSPGPCSPKEAGISVPIIHWAMQRTIPLLGVCLGHQAIGAAMGARVTRADTPVHGKTSEIIHDGLGVFSNIPSPFTVARYHSLIVQDIPDDLIVCATTHEENIIMGLRHKTLPIHGVQFHPESIATSYGQQLINNFVQGINVR